MKYHKRMSVATRYMQIEPMTFRNTFLIGLRDAALREMAITSDWSVEATVAAGTRKEQLRANEARERPPEPVSVRSLEVNVLGDQLQQRETGFKYRARGSRGSGARRQRQQGSMSSGGGLTRSVGPNDCQQCGRSSHGGRTCPAIGRACNNCREIGHFRAVCKKQLSIAPIEQVDSRKQLNQVGYF